MRHKWLRRLALGLALSAGCSSRALVRYADIEGAEIGAEKMAVVDAFRTQLQDPAEGQPREPEPIPTDIPAIMTVEDAVVIAKKYARDYKTAQEAYFLSALSLSLTRHNELDPILSGNIGWGGSDGHSLEFAESTALALTVTQKLPTGGRLTASGSTSIGTDGTGQDVSSSGSVSVTQQLLRGGPRWIAFEGLTQAERNVIYAARTFEAFRQTFAIAITRQFYDLVVDKKQLAITEQQTAAQEFAYKVAQAKFKQRKSPQIDVFRAERDYRNAQNNVLRSRQDYETSVDRFKIRLGLPLAVQFDVADDLPDQPIEVNLDAETAADAALYNRLDLLTQRERLEDTKRSVLIAKNALLPNLSVDAAYAVSGAAGSYGDLSPFDNDIVTFGINLEIPFDRKAERNSYRSSLISLARGRRALNRSEDDTIVSVRASLRGLRLARESIENDELNVETDERARKTSNINFQAGRASNRDLVEAINNLASTQISLLRNYVNYEIARLELFQQLGVLFVDKEGRIVK